MFFLNEVENCDIYLGILGQSYSFEDSDIVNILTHLNLIKENRVTNAALLLFADSPQRFFITSEVKCAHFHGTSVSKPIPSYQVYKGDVFEMIEQAVDFVLSKINLYVGDRSKNVTVDVEYEIPKQVVTEAIVNAVAHRDYTSNGSVQVMLFADRFEVSNPGNFPHELTVEQLYTTHHSLPANPLLANALYLIGTIEQMGTGTEEMTKQCLAKGLGKPEFSPHYGFKTVIRRQQQVTQQVTQQVKELLKIFDGEMNRAEIQEVLKLNDRENFRRNYIQPALKLEFIELVYPDNPSHPRQKYRLTKKAIEFLKNS